MSKPAKLSLRARLHAAWRRSLLNPYHLDTRLMKEGIGQIAPALEGRALDVGCGERQYAALFTNVRRYVGIEHLGAVINVDPTLAGSVAHVAHLVDAFAEGERIPFRDASFDSAMAIEVLEHVPEPHEVVAEVARVLKPGGAFLVTVPFVGELHQIPYDYRRFTSFGIERLLRDHGFDVERILTRGNFIATAGRVLSHAIYRLGAKNVKRDGAVRMHKWAIPLLLPLCACAVGTFGFLSRFSNDDSLCLGYVVLARRRAEAGASGAV